jgi:hypothetical protein
MGALSAIRNGGSALLAWTGAVALACASSGPSPHPALATAWRDYQALPEQRAIAIAGDPSQQLWVTGATGGHATREQAEAEAIAQCQIRRAARRMQAACVLYAVGDEIVWRGR